MQTQKLMDMAVQCHRDGDLNGASEGYSKVLHAAPDHAHAWNLSGVLAHQMGRHAEGIQFLTHAIHLRDDIPEYHLNLATALVESREPQQAETRIRRCLKLDPRLARAWNVLGNAQHAQNRVTDSIDSFKRALKLDQRDVDAWISLGQAYRSAGQPEDAESATRKALQVAPQHPVALDNLAVLLAARKCYDEALPLWQQVLEQQPKSAKTLVNMGNALHKQGQIAAAKDAFERAIEAEPQHANAWNSLGYSYSQIAEVEPAIQCYQRVLELDPHHASAASNYLFALNLTEIDRQACHDAHVAVAQLLPRERPNQFANVLDANRPLRIGYVSPDLRRHPLISFFEPILDCHDRQQFEPICYANVEQPDEVSQRLQAKSGQWRNVFGASDDALVKQIIDDQVDILIDLAGHTANARLAAFARRAAPVQVSMLGYLNTTGVPAMDYVISDALRDPVAEDKYYTEQLVRLPTGGCCWQPPNNALDVADSPCLQTGHITLGSTHRPNKLTPETLRLWADVMDAVPDCRLLVFHNALQESAELQTCLWSRFQAAGLDLQRIDMAWDDGGQYMTAYQAIDILLETTPWSSGTTALDCMWQGVPIPTLYGAAPCGRATASLLNRLQLSDLVANDTQEYVNIVQRLAGDRPRLQQLRNELRPRMQETVCDAATFVRELESAYRTMWSRACDAA